MKKIIFVIGLFLSFGILSCSSGDDNVEVTTANVVGYWETVSHYYLYDDGTKEEQNYPENLRLYDDGNYTHVIEYPENKYYLDRKYKLMGNAIDLFYNSSSAHTYIIEELTADRMSLRRDYTTYEEKNVKEYWTLKRVH